jgi:hypothetical protein
MMLARVLPWSVAKEVRALGPVWLGSLASLLGLAYVSAHTAAGNGYGTGRIDSLLVLMYAGTSVALGALSVGHEYSARTLPLLLCQPVSRTRIFLVKQSVLALMLLTMAGVVWANASVTSNAPPFLITLSLLGGLFVAPWLTMLSRTPLGGIVFTFAVPGLLGILVYGFVPDPGPLVVLWLALVSLSMIALVMGWRTFMRLEAVEGRGADVRWPATEGELAPARRRRPIWLLVKKELGLQQLAFAVAGIYLVGSALTALQARIDPRYEDLFGTMTFVYSGLLALLIGSLASAEERHLSTAQWQLLLPMASWKQWIVKAGTALGLAVLLAVALPALLMYLSDGHVRINEWYACAVLLLTTVSLYVSSLSTSGVRALCLSVPVSLFVVFPALALVSRLGWIRLSPVTIGLFAVMLAVVLYVALLNHRSAERGVLRIGVQVAWIAGCFAFCVVLAAVLTFHVHF